MRAGFFLTFQQVFLCFKKRKNKCPMHQLFFSSDLSPAANIQYILLKIFFNELFFILFLSKDRFSFEVRNSFCDVGPVKQNVTGGLHYINVSS